MKSKRRSTLFAAGGLCTNSLGAFLSLLAFGLPNWIYFDKTFTSQDFGDVVSDVDVKYQYGFWRYCNKITWNTSSLDTCGDVDTSTGRCQCRNV